MVDYLKDNFRQNYVTLTAGNGEEALAIMKEHRVDIVLSDVMMPVLTVSNFASLLNEICKPATFPSCCCLPKEVLMHRRRVFRLERMITLPNRSRFIY